MSDEPTPEQLGSDLVLYAARLIRAVRRSVRQPVGVRVLSLLDEHGSPIGVSALAALDGSSQPSMSGTVHALVERGWVEKERDPADARSSLVRLTDAGREVLAEARRVNGAHVAERFRAGTHTTDELATTVALIRDLIGQYQDDEDEATGEPGASDDEEDRRE